MEKLEKARLINASDLTTSSAITPTELHASSQLVGKDMYKMKEYPSRWLAFIGFSLGSAINGVVWISLVAITDEVEEAYGVDSFFLNM